MDAKQLQALLAQNIKKARKALHISQMELASKADVSIGHINDIEGSRRWVSADSFTRIAQALNLEPYQLLLPTEKQEALSSFELLARLQNDLKGTLVKEIEHTFSEYFVRGPEETDTTAEPE